MPLRFILKLILHPDAPSKDRRKNLPAFKVPVEGGLPIMMGGKVVGGVGLSGGTSAQDGQCAKAGVDAVSSGAIALTQVGAIQPTLVGAKSTRGAIGASRPLQPTDRTLAPAPLAPTAPSRSRS